MEHGFNGVYLGDLERLQDIQKKRDVTNRNWQRIILYNIAKSLAEDASEQSPLVRGKLGSKRSGNSAISNAAGGAVDTNAHSESPFPKDLNRTYVIETRQLWFKLHEKMQSPEYGNMLLLVRMRDELEDRMYRRRQRYLTFVGYEELVNKLHLDAEGHVVEPFVAVSERHDRDERHRLYLESFAQDLDEAVLMK